MKLVEPFVAHSQAGALAIACIEDAAGFRALREEWALLHSACPDSTPFNSWEWLFSWWQAYGHGKRLRLLSCRLDGQLVGIAPLYVACEKTGIGTSARVLRMVGDGSADSDYLGFIMRPDLRRMLVSQLCQWIATDRCWDVLALRELQESSPLPHGLCQVAEHHKFSLRIEHGRCGVAELPRTFDDFLQSRQPRFRTKLRSLLKKLDQSGLVFQTAVSPRQLKARLRSLFALHQARWHGVGKAGVFDQAAKRLFYAHFVPRFARRGWLRLYSLRDGDSYLAHQLCFGADGTTYLLQEGFDVSNAAASYGQMLRAAVMRHLIERGETRYDFLGGFSKHKQDWGATEGKTVHLVMAQPQWRGWLYFKLPLWREQSASAAKRLLPPTAVRILKRTREGLS
jgi:CelD/BcsL family acetyltransferase involved in cellulose biosynthesis